MKKNKVRISSQLKDDLKKYAVEVSKKLAKDTRDEMVDGAADAIAQFYADYTPIRYKRHYYNFENNSFKGYYKNPHNQIIRGGVQLTSENMDDIYGKVPTHDITETVFNLVYLGFHGNITATGHGSEIPQMKPDPQELIENKREDIIKNINSFKNDAIQKADEGSYKTLRF